MFKVVGNCSWLWYTFSCTREILNEITTFICCFIQIISVYSPQENGGEKIKSYDQFKIDQQLKVSSRQVGENVVEKEEENAKKITV